MCSEELIDAEAMWVYLASRHLDNLLDFPEYKVYLVNVCYARFQPHWNTCHKMPTL